MTTITENTYLGVFSDCSHGLHPQPVRETTREITLERLWGELLGNPFHLWQEFISVCITVCERGHVHSPITPVPQSPTDQRQDGV